MEYKEAMSELEQILEDINGEQTDIDQLTSKLERATALIKLCKAKLRSTEDQLQNIFEDGES